MKEKIDPELQAKRLQFLIQQIDKRRLFLKRYLFFSKKDWKMVKQFLRENLGTKYEEQVANAMRDLDELERIYREKKIFSWGKLQKYALYSGFFIGPGFGVPLGIIFPVSSNGILNWLFWCWVYLFFILFPVAAVINNRLKNSINETKNELISENWSGEKSFKYLINDLINMLNELIQKEELYPTDYSLKLYHKDYENISFLHKGKRGPLTGLPDSKAFRKRIKECLFLYKKRQYYTCKKDGKRISIRKVLSACLDPRYRDKRCSKIK